MGALKFKWDVGYTAALLLCGGVWLAQQSGVIGASGLSRSPSGRVNQEVIELNDSAFAEIAEGEDSGDFAKNGAPAVVLLVAEWCGYCRSQEKALSSNNIPFKKLDIEKSSTGQSLYERLGGGGVPITIVGNSVIRGFDPKSVISAFNRESKPAAFEDEANVPDYNETFGEDSARVEA